MSRQQPTDVVARDEASIRTDNTTAHQGLFKAEFTPPIPLEVLGAAQGQVYTEEELNREFDHPLCPRRTHPYGCVTWHSYHFAIEGG
jgi:hypothetical protein